MKVSTDLKAGALAQTLSDLTASLTSPLDEFFAAAQSQAETVAGRVTGVFTGFWRRILG